MVPLFLQIESRVFTFIDSEPDRDDRTFVDGRTREVIMEEMRRRIDRGDAEREIEETIQVSSLLHQVCAQSKLD